MASPKDVPAGTTGPVQYRERLYPSPGAWAATAVVPVGISLCLIPLGGWVSLVALLALGAACAAALHNHAGEISVGATGAPGTQAQMPEPELRAGRAHIPTRLLRGAQAHVGQEADAQRRHLLDPQAHLMLRGWIQGVVRVELDDPQDPTPYWLVSSRHPQRLADAINASVR